MTITLRKWHRNIWPIIGIVLIIGGITAFKSLPDDNGIGAPVQLSENGFSAHLNEAKKVLEIDITKGQRVPSFLLYLSNNGEENINNDRLLGQVDKIGKFQFPLDSIAFSMPNKVIKAYNPIHQQLIFQTIITK